MGLLYLDADVDLDCTTPVASPGVVNSTAHNLIAGTPVVFYTIGASTLPTGITAGTTYYVRSTGLTADAFQISATIGGAAINFTGSSSGTNNCSPALASGSSNSAGPDLRGTGAIRPPNTTFTDANVNTGTDDITITTHGYTTGMGAHLTTTGVLPSPLTIATYYYIRAIDANTIRLYPSVADAIADTNQIDITSAAGGGTHTVNNCGISLDGSPDLSILIVNSFYIVPGDTGTSHIMTMQGGNHGITAGDRVWIENGQSGTMPGGLVEGQFYYANPLTATTFRLYSTRALAVAGGASDINVTSVGARRLWIRGGYDENASHSPGPAQSSIHCPSSSFSNQQIVWIIAYDNTNKIVTVTTAITGLNTASPWGIGGKLGTGGTVFLVNSIRRGDNVFQATDIFVGNTQLTYRNHEAEAFGGISWYGAAGARRLLANTANISLFNTYSGGSGVFRNLELSQGGVTGSVFANGSSSPIVFDDCKFSDAGSNMFSTNILSVVLYQCEVSAVPSWGSNTNTSSQFLYQSYLHDMGSTSAAAYGMSNAGGVIIESIIDSGGAFGITMSGIAALFFMMVRSTIYKCNNSGFETTVNTGVNGPQAVLIFDNIFKDNGNASAEANIEIPYEANVMLEDRNDITIAGSRGGVNTINWTLGAADITTDPLFVDPDNASAALRNFNLDTGSPARGANFPFTYLGNSTTTYRDLGASQHQDSGGGGGDGQPVIGGWH